MAFLLDRISWSLLIERLRLTCLGLSVGLYLPHPPELVAHRLTPGVSPTSVLFPIPPPTLPIPPQSLIDPSRIAIQLVYALVRLVCLGHFWMWRLITISADKHGWVINTCGRSHNSGLGQGYLQMKTMFVLISNV